MPVQEVCKIFEVSWVTGGGGNAGNIITQGCLLVEEFTMHFRSVFTREGTSSLHFFTESYIYNLQVVPFDVHFNDIDNAFICIA